MFTQKGHKWYTANMNSLKYTDNPFSRPAQIGSFTSMSCCTQLIQTYLLYSIPRTQVFLANDWFFWWSYQIWLDWQWWQKAAHVALEAIDMSSQDSTAAQMWIRSQWLNEDGARRMSVTQAEVLHHCPFYGSTRGSRGKEVRGKERGGFAKEIS